MTAEHGPNIYFEPLGCARNLVDSEIMMGNLSGAGGIITDDPADADIIIINTCSFIEDAVNESLDVIFHLARYKTSGKCRFLVVAGCLPERYREKLEAELPEVDLFLGTGALDQVIRAMNDRDPLRGCFLPDPNRLILTGCENRFRGKTAPASAYLKIAEGCDKHCTYCIIPRLRGKQRSRPIGDIVSEAAMLIEKGVKELVLVAQETSFYGRDLSPATDISTLLNAVARLSGGVWIRLLYGHPESVDEKLIKTIAANETICSYFDIPVQHAADPVLKRMGRNYTLEDIYRRIDQVRTHIPDAVLRSTVIVGFPGESEKDFETLMRLVERVRFNHLGAFIYSDSDDLVSHRLKHHVPAAIAKKRYDRLMERQRDISTAIHGDYVGRTVKVLVEEHPEPDVYIGRADFQAPEVDGITYINCRQAPLGDFMNVAIVDALEYDLVGEPL